MIVRRGYHSVLASGGVTAERCRRFFDSHGDDMQVIGAGPMGPIRFHHDLPPAELQPDRRPLAMGGGGTIYVIPRDVEDYRGLFRESVDAVHKAVGIPIDKAIADGRLRMASQVRHTHDEGVAATLDWSGTRFATSLYPKIASTPNSISSPSVSEKDRAVDDPEVPIVQRFRRFVAECGSDWTLHAAGDTASLTPERFESALNATGAKGGGLDRIRLELPIATPTSSNGDAERTAADASAGTGGELVERWFNQIGLNAQHLAWTFAELDDALFQTLAEVCLERDFVSEVRSGYSQDYFPLMDVEAGSGPRRRWPLYRSSIAADVDWIQVDIVHQNGRRCAEVMGADRDHVVEAAERLGDERRIWEGPLWGRWRT